MMKIVIFSDLHYASEKPISSIEIMKRKLTECAEPLIEELITQINNDIKPDLVLSLGDLIESFKDCDKDIANLKYILNKLKSIDSPFYSCIGNHELRGISSREQVEEIIGYKHSSFSFDMNGLHIVMLGTCIDNDLGPIFKSQYISNEDISWLKEDLNKNTLPTIVCLHFGVAEDNLKENWWFANITAERGLLGNRKELKEILKKDKNILAVFSGHQHWTKTIIEDNIPYYVLGSMTENINDDGIPDGVYFIVEFNGEKLNVIEKHIRI